MNQQRRFQSMIDQPLNAGGRKQAESLSTWVMQFRPTCVLTSPLLRAKETAEIAIGPMRLEIKIDPRLKEREAPEYEGMSIVELARKRKLAGQQFRDPTQDWEEVTSVEQDKEVFQRFFAVVKSVTRSQNERILVVTHAGVVKSVFHELFLIPPERPCVLKIRNGGVMLLEERLGNEWAFLGLWNPL